MTKHIDSEYLGLYTLLEVLADIPPLQLLAEHLAPHLHTTLTSIWYKKEHKNNSTLCHSRLRGNDTLSFFLLFLYQVCVRLCTVIN